MRGIKTAKTLAISIAKTLACLAAIAFPLFSAPLCLALDAPSVDKKGSFVSPQSVTITCPTCPVGTSYYFTEDGSQPTTGSNLYSSPITIKEPTQLNVVAHNSGTYSDVTTVYYDIDPGLSLVLVAPPGVPTWRTPQLWLKSDLFVTTSTDSPEKVSHWADTSAGQHHATGAEGTSPVFSKNAINGCPALSFDGTTSFLTLLSDFGSFSGGTVFAVVQPKALTANARILDLGTGSDTNINIMLRIANSGSYGEFGVYNNAGGGTFAPSLNPLSQNMYQVLSGTRPSTGTTGRAYINQIAGNDTTLHTIASTARNTNYIGRASGGSNYFQGNICEVLLYNQALSDIQIQAVQAFLVQKYQLFNQTTPAKPVFSLAAGTLSQPTQLVLRSEPGTLIRYTTDNNNPTLTSPVWNGCPYTINFTQTIKAIAVRNGIASTIESKTYTLNSSQFPAPLSGDTTAPSINNLQSPVPSQLPEN